MSSVKVAVRVRPFNNREIIREAECIIEVDGQKTSKSFALNTKISHSKICVLTRVCTVVEIDGQRTSPQMHLVHYIVEKIHYRKPVDEIERFELMHVYTRLRVVEKLNLRVALCNF